MMNESVEKKENPPDNKKRIKPFWLWALSVCLIAVGIISLFLLSTVEYMLVVDDIPYTLKVSPFASHSPEKRWT